MSDGRLLSEFQEYPKIFRLMRDIVITEKLDGTNAQVAIDEQGVVRAGSRNRWITPEADNHGFAGWVKAHEEELRTGLGIGRHFGEWWGGSIQKRYKGFGTEKRFALFNVALWTDDKRPACCSVPPVLYRGEFRQSAIDEALSSLRVRGSLAAPGCMNPEGIVVFHTASNTCFKVTLDGDAHKGPPPT